MVFQRPVLLRRSAQANVAYALSLRGVDGAARRQRVDAALERFGLTGLGARSARVLSGGEQQRLALARAWRQASTLPRRAPSRKRSPLSPRMPSRSS
jgi:tungstate transport system ATP-binding protein